MKITPAELIKLELWEVFCQKTGLSVWAIYDGLIDRDELIFITIEDAQEMGIIKF